MPQANESAGADLPVFGNDLLRMPAVIRHTGLSRSTIYRLMSTRRFPFPVKLAGRAIGWRKSDVDRWNESLTTAVL